MHNLKHFMLSILILLLGIFPSSVSAQDQRQHLLPPEKIIVWRHTIDNPSAIIMDTLTRALDITRDEYGDYEIIPSMQMEQGRAVKKLSKEYKGKLDIAYFPTTAEREERAIPIRIPLIGGLMGYRLCLIKENNQYKFSNINDIQDFIDQGLTIGQHQDWPDSIILRNNGLKVSTTHKYSLLFEQLNKQRFDCFLRGVNEINDEYAQHSNARFAIENSLLIHYPYLTFFFVNEQRPELAERLTIGLRRLQENGTLTKLLDHYYKDRLNKLHLYSRKILYLDNTLISDQSLQSMTVIPWL
ncbi:transporter substrate-binding domain-containing protein [Psychromonas arctica]|uniref:transporter substrate-binding domain-containing protein n=1 Tax=Psychromonas arctica TaxID=168275 RepID=UPI00040D86BA|nr:transporter substrate-binding domain-containing protein [Psychromonas arctica]